MDKNTYIKQLSKILNIEFVNELLKLIYQRCVHIRTPKYSNEYYLYHITLVLVHFHKWNSLMILHTNNKKNHYKTIQTNSFKME
jgi:hypothetical protein